MRRQTKIFRIGAAAIAAAVLAACGGGGEDVAETTEETTVTVEETVEETVETVEETTETVESVNAQALVDQCVAEGESEDVCNCQIGAVEEALGTEDFSKLIDLAKNDDEEGAEQLMTEIMSEKPEIAMEMGMKMMGCTGG